MAAKKHLFNFLIFTLTISLVYIGKNHPQQEKAVTVLLLLTPVLIYALNRNVNIAVIGLLSILKVGQYFLPLQDTASKFLFTNRYIKLAIFSYAVYKACRLLYSCVYRILHEKQLNTQNRDYHEIIKRASNSLYPDNKMYSAILAQEISTLSYALFLWKKPQFTCPQFSYTKTSNTLVIYYILLLVATIETCCVHLILFHFKLYIVSFLLLFLNTYTIVFFIAHIKALNQRPVTMEDGFLIIRNGIFATATIDVSTIIAIQISNTQTRIEKHSMKIKLALLRKVEMHNVKVTLNKNTHVSLLYGIEKWVNELYFFVDDKTGLVKEIEEKIQPFRLNTNTSLN